MLTRKASAPASASLRIMLCEALAGPSVARILTFRLRGTNWLGSASLIGMGGRIDTPAASSTRSEQECVSRDRPLSRAALDPEASDRPLQTPGSPCRDPADRLDRLRVEGGASIQTGGDSWRKAM